MRRYTAIDSQDRLRSLRVRSEDLVDWVTPINGSAGMSCLKNDPG